MSWEDVGVHDVVSDTVDKDEVMHLGVCVIEMLMMVMMVPWIRQRYWCVKAKERGSVSTTNSTDEDVILDVHTIW